VTTALRSGMCPPFLMHMLARGRKREFRTRFRESGRSMIPKKWDPACRSYVPCQALETSQPELSRESFDAMIVQWWERSLETSVILLLSACLTAYPELRLGLSLSTHGRRSCDLPHSETGNSPNRGDAPAIARDDLAGPLPRHRLPGV
jgi:hypothetical protein